MSTTLSAYIESITNSNGRFRTLKNIHFVPDASGGALFRASSRAVTFMVMAGDNRQRVVCPFGYTQQERAAAEKTCFEYSVRNNPYLSRCEYYRNELLVFTPAGEHRWTDVVIEEDIGGVPLHDFIRSNLYSAVRRPLRDLLKNLSEMAASLSATGMVHGNLTAENIAVTTGCRPVGMNWSFVQPRSSYADEAALAFQAICTFVAASEPTSCRIVGELEFFSQQGFLRNASHILTQAEFLRLNPLTELLGMTQEIRRTTPETLHTALSRLASTPFVPMPLLAELLRGEYDRPIDISSAPTVQATRTPDTTLRVELRRCDEVGTLSDTLLRFRQGDRWDYADPHGERLTTQGFLAAEDFYEGRAKVETTTGCGLLDRQGEYAMAPIYEMLEWHGQANVASACLDGKWELYDRQGKQLTGLACEWIGDFSEGFFVARRGRKFGYLRPDGSALTGFRFDDAYSFSGGRALVSSGGAQFHIGPDGQRI